MKRRTVLVLSGLVAVIIGLVVVGTALAQTPTPKSNRASDGYLETFLNRLSSSLGVSRQKLDEGMTQARNETLDQAVKDGKLTKEQAEKLKAQQSPGPMFGLRGVPSGPKGGDFRGKGMVALPGVSMREVVAKALGMTSEELTNQIRAGKSLRELAKGKEQAVKDAFLKAHKELLDQAVKDGRLSQDQANRLYERFQKMDPLSMMGGSGGNGQRPGKGPMGPGKGPTRQSAPHGTGMS